MVLIAPRISLDPSIRGGRPVIAGTRVPVDILVGKVASGMAAAEVAEEYGVAPEDVLAALAYAAQLVSDERVRAAS
ncbi:MAG: DUF433 domain-containing protein [Deltaproteobacteria bacterium]|nr:DUF433 domain-containing protein [Deltaproteobacteria bacterium]